MAKSVKAGTALQCDAPLARGTSEELRGAGDNLYLRVRANSKQWLFIYKRGSKSVKLNVGPYGKGRREFSLAGARAHVKPWQDWLNAGKDPKEELERERLEAEAEKARLAARITVNTLFDQWDKAVLSGHKDGGENARRLFTKDILPHLGGLFIEDVGTPHIMRVVDALLARGVDRTAKVAFSLMRQMFRFAGPRYEIADPTARIKKDDIGKAPAERSRVLAEAEIKELSTKVEQANLTDTTKAAIWIQLATGCRIGELLKAEWHGVDLEAGTWVIPPEHSKNGEPLTVYLSEFSLRHFKALKEVNGDSQWCYPDRTGKQHVCPKSVTKQVADRQLLDDRKPMSNRSLKDTVSRPLARESGTRSATRSDGIVPARGQTALSS
jgi:integrase